MTWERRWHPLRREWVTITSHRQSRPWSGADAAQTRHDQPRYVDDCYLCPGNARVSGEQNEDYASVFVFDNDHPSFSGAAASLTPAPGIYENAAASGLCRVVCYSPDHSQTMAELSVEGVDRVLACWGEQTRELSARDDVSSVLIFENKGEIVGVSNPHPHGQIYAPSFVFPTIETEAESMRAYSNEKGGELFSAIIRTELEDGQRIVAESDCAVAFLPWFARFPYELYVAPKRPVGFIFELGDDERLSLAGVLSEALIRLDNLWQQSFPYMLVLHQAPCDGRDTDHYHCHIQIHPPLRGPGLQKFLAGVETGGGHFLNDTDPDDKAAELRAVPDIHYRTTASS